MIGSETRAIDSLMIEDFLNAKTCEGIIAEMEVAVGGLAHRTYGGGELIFHGPYSGPAVRLPVIGEPGALVAFRAEATHEVVPVTHGERYTIVSWYR